MPEQPITYLERSFNRFTEKHPGWSSLVCFVSACHDQKPDKDKIRSLFRKLVGREDYEGYKSYTILESIYRMLNVA